MSGGFKPWFLHSPVLSTELTLNSCSPRLINDWITLHPYCWPTDTPQLHSHTHALYALTSNKHTVCYVQLAPKKCTLWIKMKSSLRLIVSITVSDFNKTELAQISLCSVFFTLNKKLQLYFHTTLFLQSLSNILKMFPIILNEWRSTCRNLLSKMEY